MKDFKTYFVVFLLACVTVWGLQFNAADKATFQNGYAWSGSSSKDNATQWAIDMQALTEAGVNLGTGKIFYVDSGVSNEGNGTSWDRAKDTLDEGINLCTANRGDVIFVAQGHNEGISTAGAISLDVAGVRIIGHGRQSLKPTIDYDAVTASFRIPTGGDNSEIHNIRFRCSANSTNIAIDGNDGATGILISNCDFGFAETATDEFDDAVITRDACNYWTIRGCLFDGGAQAAQSAVLFSKDTKGTIVEGNLVQGTYAVAPVEGDTTASTNLTIRGNEFFTGGSADTFNLVAASTGIVSNNIVVFNATSVAGAMDIGNCMNIGNIFIADDDVGGTKSDPNSTESYASITGSADD